MEFFIEGGAQGRSESTQLTQGLGVVQPCVLAHAFLRRPACHLSNLNTRKAGEA